MSKRTYNITTNFALPLLGWRRSIFEPYLINSYIYHKGVDHFKEDHLFLLLEESEDYRFKKMEETIVNSDLHVAHYYVDEKQLFSMHVFTFIPERLEDYKLFLAGKYSRISDHGKNLIKMNSKPNGFNYRILDRSKDLRKMQQKKIGETEGTIVLSDEDEVWSSIYDKNNIQNEIFRSEMLELITSH